MESKVNLETKGSCLTLELNRPEKRNAFDQEMIAEITEALNTVAKNQEASVLILKGKGKSFSAGADLSYMKSMADYDLGQNIKDSHKLRNMFLALQKIPFPVIAQLQGHVMGGALGLVAASDIVAAEKDTLFCFSEVKFGLSPAVVSEFVAPKIPRTHLQRLFLTAEVFNGKTAKDLGLVHYVGETVDVEDYVQAQADRLMANGPLALRETKALLQKLYVQPHKFSEVSVDLISRLRMGAEGQEGLSAFFEKRAPKWAGR